MPYPALVMDYNGIGFDAIVTFDYDFKREVIAFNEINTAKQYKMCTDECYSDNLPNLSKIEINEDDDITIDDLKAVLLRECSRSCSCKYIEAVE